MVFPNCVCIKTGPKTNNVVFNSAKKPATVRINSRLIYLHGNYFLRSYFARNASNFKFEVIIR